MNTWSHAIVGGALNRVIKRRQAANPEAPERVPPIKSVPFLVGSFLPDLPLILLSIGFIIYDMTQGNFGNPAENRGESATAYLFDTMFFEDPWVIAAQNAFHSPFLTILYTVIGYLAWKRGLKWGPLLFWLGLGCTLHTLADIPLHVDDGPLLLFPLNWELRYFAPLSYWDERYYAREWSIFEQFVLDIPLLIWLVWPWVQKRRARRRANASVG